jgi:hypothetical protein
MLEERGMADDSGMDEEDLYGAVVRDVNPNKYVPPALRKQLQQQQQQQQVKKDLKGTNNGPLNKLITSDLPKASGSNPSPIANLPTTRREPSDKNSEKVHLFLGVFVKQNQGGSILIPLFFPLILFRQQQQTFSHQRELKQRSPIHSSTLL